MNLRGYLALIYAPSLMVGLMLAFAFEGYTGTAILTSVLVKQGCTFLPSLAGITSYELKLVFEYNLGQKFLLFCMGPVYFTLCVQLASVIVLICLVWVKYVS